MLPSMAGWVPLIMHFLGYHFAYTIIITVVSFIWLGRSLIFIMSLNTTGVLSACFAAQALVNIGLIKLL